MPVNVKELYVPKALGDNIVGKIKSKTPGVFSARLRIPVGILTADVLEGISALARKYGNGQVFLTTRLGVEIPHIKEVDFLALRSELALLGVELAGCGPRMRSTVACKGTVCSHGNVDTFELAWAIDKAFNNAEILPHKFKVTVGGCPSSCAKPHLNDVGLVGVARVTLSDTDCTGCGLCVKACQVGALELSAGKASIDRAKCVNCGACARSCPFNAWKVSERGVDLFAGGRWGRAKQVGFKVGEFLTADEAQKAVGNIKKWYSLKGLKKERLGQAILRVGMKAFQEAALEGLPPQKRTRLTAKAKADFARIL